MYKYYHMIPDNIGGVISPNMIGGGKCSMCGSPGIIRVPVH